VVRIEQLGAQRVGDAGRTDERLQRVGLDGQGHVVRRVERRGPAPQLGAHPGSIERFEGSYYGSARVTRDFPRFIELIETGRVDLGGMVTRHFALEQVNDAIAAMRDGDVVRGVLAIG
jgi:threonine dehydrogenase-like Zn-dependent dehydrogenase